MRLLKELGLGWQRHRTRGKGCAILGLAVVGCASPAHAQVQAQVPVPAREYIVVGGGIKPETVSLSLQESCFGTRFRFAIVNRPDGSFLVEARRGGRPPRRLEGVAAVRRYLAGVRNVRFMGTKCVSADEIKISLRGLSAHSGSESELSQLFTIRF